MSNTIQQRFVWYFASTLCGIWLVGSACTHTPPIVSHTTLATATVLLPTATATTTIITITTTTISNTATPDIIVMLPTPEPTPVATITPTPEPTLIPVIERKQLFEEVWNTVNDYYLYDDFHGVDWQHIQQQYAPWVASARSNEEFYALLSDMVNQLGDQHSRFLAPSDAVVENEQSTGMETKVGIGVVTMITADGAVIQQIIPGSPADEAGLQLYDRIIAINGMPCFKEPCDNIHGSVDTEVRLTVTRSDNTIHDIVLTRRHMNIRIAPVTRRLPNDIGYIAIPSLWINDMDAQVSAALTDLVVEKPLRGLIIDLRRNPGGWREVLIGVLSHFVQGDVGAFFDRQQQTPLIVHEQSGPDLRHVPFVVLIDNTTASYAEVMAGILQQEAGAILIGQQTPGNTETIYAYELTNGARLWLAQEGFRLRNGINLEGTGITPDIVIDTTWNYAPSIHDPFVQEAVRYFE